MLLLGNKRKQLHGKKSGPAGGGGRREANYFEAITNDGGQGTLKRHPKGITFHYSQPPTVASHHSSSRQAAQAAAAAYFYQPQSQLLQPYYQAKMQAAAAAAAAAASSGGGVGGGLADLSQGSCDNTPATPDSLDSMVASNDTNSCNDTNPDVDEDSRASSNIHSPRYPRLISIH